MTITYQYSRLQRFQERVTAMIADPECHGDLLLVGVGLAHELLLNPKVTGSRTWHEITDPLLKPGKFGKFGERYGRTVRDIVRQDIRRYDMFAGQGRGIGQTPCAAPMQRRDGLCGKAASLTTSEVDYETGERHLIGACSRADHQQWFRTHRRFHADQAADRIIPKPYANAGGVLARHFPSLDWEDAWVSIDRQWEAPPERDPADSPEPTDEPRFKLILGDAEGGDGNRVLLEVLGDGGLWEGH